MALCKWYENEFCVNFDCPACADWCPVDRDEEVMEMCKYYEPKDNIKE